MSGGRRERGRGSRNGGRDEGGKKKEGKATTTCRVTVYTSVRCFTYTTAHDLGIRPKNIL